MKRLALLLLLALCGQAEAQWYTAWSERTALVLCLHLTDSLPELYSPLQSGSPIPVSQSSLRGDTLRIECASIGFKTTLVRHADGWQGAWRQGIIRENIVFHPDDTLFQLRRPQEPLRPFSFCEEEITADYIDSQGNPVHLSGTLTFPATGKKHYPTLLIVSGSGQQNRDEELLGHKPFLVLADYLASRGIALVRYDDRGVGLSTGALDSADAPLFAEDAEAMLEAVRKNKHVDRKRLGIGGHSEGAAIAPIVASRNRAVTFVVMLAGQGHPGLDVLLQQNEAIFRANGIADSLIATRQACLRELFLLPPTSTAKDYQTVIARHTEGFSSSAIDSMGLGRGAAHAMHTQMSSRWMQTFLHLDPASYLPRVKCPILALNGSLDCQVVATPNLDRIRQLTQHRADCRLLPGLNHLFQHCSTGSPSEYVSIEETFAPEAMQAIADWILAL